MGHQRPRVDGLVPVRQGRAPPARPMVRRVCEGFTGNVILKEAEAFYSAIRKRGIKDAFFDRFNYELYGGTPILGINSTVMIGHGMSSPLAICNMLLLSAEVASSGLSQKIHNAFQP